MVQCLTAPGRPIKSYDQNFIWHVRDLNLGPWCLLQVYLLN